MKLDLEALKEVRQQKLPKGDGPYARAKRAHWKDQDFEKAEELFREAIKGNDSRGSAVKDLASLLHQQGRAEEAIQLLKSERGKGRVVSPYDNA